MLPRKAKGRRPVFTGDPHTDKLYAIILALATETSVLRERLDTVERLLAVKEVLAARDIEDHVLDEPAQAEREQWRARFLERLFRVVSEQIQSEAAGESAEKSEATVREIEGHRPKRSSDNRATTGREKPC